MSKYIDADLIEPFIKREEWNTPDERWRPESEFGRFIDAIPPADVQEVVKEWCNERNCLIVAREDFARMEVRHGRWEFDFLWYVCSSCGKHISFSTLDDDSEPAYCPNCGAKMDEVKE